jgi:hypothetical protein
MLFPSFFGGSDRINTFSLNLDFFFYCQNRSQFPHDALHDLSVKFSTVLRLVLRRFEVEVGGRGLVWRRTREVEVQ